MVSLCSTAVLCFMLAAPLVRVADIDGYYDCAGAYPSGGTYESVVMIRQGPDGRYRVTWATPAGTVRGVAMRDGMRLTVGWIDGGVPGTSAFRITVEHGKPHLSGHWVAGDESSGDEVLTFLRKFTPRE